MVVFLKQVIKKVFAWIAADNHVLSLFLEGGLASDTLEGGRHFYLHYGVIFYVAGYSSTFVMKTRILFATCLYILVS